MNSVHLRRYSDLTALIYLLSERKITLSNPASWDDTNDSYYLALYREKKSLKSVLALCFTQAQETYHHWRVFAPGSDGVCIRFTRKDLLNAVQGRSGLHQKSVTYLKLGKIRGGSLAVEDLPFLKRFAFAHESEFRMIYESKTAREPKLDIPIPLSSIDRITLSPWLHPALFPHVKKTLLSINGCSGLDIRRSTLIGNEEWKTLGEDSS